MNPFKRNWAKPGPGVPKNAPRKKGASRFLEISSRDFWSLVRLNSLLILAILPAILLYSFSLLNYFMGNAPLWLIFSLLALLACLPLGPTLTAIYYLIAQMLRDEPGFLWHDFKRKFKENFRSMVFPGLFFGAILGGLGFAFFHYNLTDMDISLFFVTVYFLAAFFVSLASPYFFVQAAYIDLPASKILQNSFMLAFGNLPRSLAGALLGSGLILLQIFFLPLSGLFLVVFGFSIPFLLNLMWIWPSIDSTYRISITLKERHNKQFDDIDSSISK